MSTWTGEQPRAIRRVALLVLMGTLFVSGAPSGQISGRPRPYFGGHWVLEDRGPNAGVWSPLGSHFTATQAPTRVVFETRLLATLDVDGPASITRDEAGGRIICAIGTEVRETYPLEPPPEPTVGIGFEQPLSSVTRCGWEGDHLVVVTHTVSRVTAPTQSPSVFETQSSHWMSIALDGPERMVVERLAVTDPVPWGAERVEPPGLERTIYRRGR